jgi:hypothetical protein
VAEVEAKLSEELGTEVKVHCPTMVDNSYHYCTAEVSDDEGLTFPVRIKPRGGDVDYTTKRWVTSARMVALGKHHLGEKLGIEVDSMTCPRISHMPDGTKVRCDATAEGIAIPIEVGMVIKVRKLSFEPVGGVVFGKRAAELAHVRLLEDKGLNVKVECPQKVIVSVPGKRFECEATMPDDTVATIHFLITGKDGQLELGTEPPSDHDPTDQDAPEKSSASAEE